MLLKWMVFLVFLAPSVFAAQHDPKANAVKVQPLSEKITALKNQISSSKKLDDKLAALIGFKKYLGTEIQKFNPEMTKKNKPLYLSLLGMDEYLKEIPFQEFSLDECSSYRDSILVSFAPLIEHPIEKDTPLEAQEALNILALICADPKLANL